MLPGSLAHNCAFLAGKVDEVGILFLQSRESLAYTEEDLPRSLKKLPLTWHVHLPLDLPWDEGKGEAAADICLELMDKIAFLAAENAVLHPPREAAPERLDAFARQWKRGGRQTRHILLENTRENDLVDIAPCIARHDFSLCMDLGHILAYGQKRLVTAAKPPGRIRMLHCSAPGGTGATQPSPAAHLPLSHLDAYGRALGKKLAAALPPDGVIMLELFDWEHIRSSLPVVEEWLADI